MYLHFLNHSRKTIILVTAVRIKVAGRDLTVFFSVAKSSTEEKNES